MTRGARGVRQSQDPCCGRGRTGGGEQGGVSFCIWREGFCEAHRHQAKVAASGSCGGRRARRPIAATSAIRPLPRPAARRCPRAHMARAWVFPSFPSLRNPLAASQPVVVGAEVMARAALRLGAGRSAAGRGQAVVVRHRHQIAALAHGCGRAGAERGPRKNNTVKRPQLSPGREAGAARRGRLGTGRVRTAALGDWRAAASGSLCVGRGRGDGRAGSADGKAVLIASKKSGGCGAAGCLRRRGAR